MSTPSVGEKRITERSHHQLIRDLAEARHNAGDHYRSPEAVCYDGLLYAYTSLRLSTAAEYVLRRGDLATIVGVLLDLDADCGHAVGFAGSTLNRLVRAAHDRVWAPGVELDAIVDAAFTDLYSVEVSAR